MALSYVIAHMALTLSTVEWADANEVVLASRVKLFETEAKKFGTWLEGGTPNIDLPIILPIWWDWACSDKRVHVAKATPEHADVIGQLVENVNSAAAGPRGITDERSQNYLAVLKRMRLGVETYFAYINAEDGLIVCAAASVEKRFTSQGHLKQVGEPWLIFNVAANSDPWLAEAGAARAVIAAIAAEARRVNGAVLSVLEQNIPARVVYADSGFRPPDDPAAHAFYVGPEGHPRTGVTGSRHLRMELRPIWAPDTPLITPDNHTRLDPPGDVAAIPKVALEPLARTVELKLTGPRIAIRSL